MANGISDDQLREMAQHRGLKLLKSRRRKPGVGDYGKFGLTDLSGKALLGIAENGLTASAADIQNYLRTSELSTWQQSAATTPARPPSRKQSLPPEPGEEEDAPVRRRSKLAPARRLGPALRQEPLPHQRKPDRNSRPKPAPTLVSRAEPAREPEAEPVHEPVLGVRAATPADAEALSNLLGKLTGMNVDPAEVSANLAKSRKLKAGMVVAELGAIIGCCSWAVIPTVHRGAIGRLTVLLVDETHRRRGVGTALLATAEKALAKAGCRQVEAMSDIMINNSHNFFRALKFEQASYRFVRGVGDQTPRERVRGHAD
ncbi:hypothetical protein ACFB49_06370 [Sphingomonas sp. DBB INV C78]|uniref:GNAT family N-acetyltransferase n=1 Tax=Sphingomonas sp. DBB INV C78 TaxID=3349434 RepID=UPI0036D2A115